MPNFIAPTRSKPAAPSWACLTAIRRGNLSICSMPEAGEAAPLAMFIHGGWWRSLDPSMFSHMARGLNARGIMVAVVGYDLCPNVGIADIIEQMRRACVFLWQRYNRRMFVVGHSAGGHLAGAHGRRRTGPSLYPKAPADLVPAGYSISGVFDLSAAGWHHAEPGFAAHRRRPRASSRRHFGRSRPDAPSMPSSAVSNSSEFMRQSQLITQGLAELRRKRATRRSPG